MKTVTIYQYEYDNILLEIGKAKQRGETLQQEHEAALARVKKLEARLGEIDEVLVVNWVGPRKDGDYRKALHDLVTTALQEHDDPKISEVAAKRQETLRELEAQVADLLEPCWCCRERGSNGCSDGCRCDAARATNSASADRAKGD